MNKNENQERGRKNPGITKSKTTRKIKKRLKSQINLEGIKYEDRKNENQRVKYESQEKTTNKNENQERDKKPGITKK